MNASRIPRHEQDFFETGLDTAGIKHIFQPFQVRVPGTSEVLDLVECSRADGDLSFIFRETTPKKGIVLHDTAGYPRHPHPGRGSGRVRRECRLQPAEGLFYCAILFPGREVWRGPFDECPGNCR